MKERTHILTLTARDIVVLRNLATAELQRCDRRSINDYSRIADLRRCTAALDAAMGQHDAASA